MDDGCFSDQKCIIATDGFAIKEVLFFRDLLLKKFAIYCSIKNGSKLLIKKESFNTFFELIKPNIHRSLQYKIFDPVTTSA